MMTAKRTFDDTSPTVSFSHELDRDLLKQFLKLVCGQTSIADNTGHCIGVDGICSRYCEDVFPVGHHDVLALSDHSITRFFKCSYRSKMWDIGNSSH